MKSARYLFAAVFLFSGVCRLSADEVSDSARGAVKEAEAKIQVEVVAPILGPGRAYTFLEAEAIVRITNDEVTKSGVGKTRKSMKGAEAEKADKDVEGSLQEQSARQEKNSSEKKKRVSLELKKMKLRVLYDSAAVGKPALEALKAALLGLYAGKLEAGDITFVPAPFYRGNSNSEASAS